MRLTVLLLFLNLFTTPILMLIYVGFGSLWAPFWFPLAHFGLTFDALWLTFDALGLTFSALGLTFGDPGARFSHFWCLLAFFPIFFYIFCEIFCKITCF